LLSYLVLIIIVGVGAWFIDGYVMHDLSKSAIHIADTAVSQVTAANVSHSEHILTQLESMSSGIRPKT
ncbi:MAG: hypothetical protein P8168_09310, partial [Deltaproteobacteria bacterium]